MEAFEQEMVHDLRERIIRQRKLIEDLQRTQEDCERRLQLKEVEYERLRRGDC